MGQRTTIILQHVKNENGKTSKETRVLYNQWGIGRITPANIMTILYSTLSVNLYCGDSLQGLCPAEMIDITDGEMDELNKADFDNPEFIGNIMRDAGNNNGGVFIKITSQPFNLQKIEFAFMLGSEEGGDYKTFCTSEEWIKRAGGRYFDDDFRKLWEGTIKYFEAIERV